MIRILPWVISIFAWILILGLAFEAKAHTPEQIDLLTDSHCHVETQHLSGLAANTAIGPFGELGKCQLSLETIAYLRWKYKIKVFNWQSPADSKYLARMVVQLCHDRLKRRFGQALDRSIIWCYNSGRLTNHPPNIRYIRWVSRRFWQTLKAN